MAAWTLTATDTPNPPRLSHEGVTAVKASFTLAAAQSLSASDIIMMVRVPNKVTILDGYISGTAGGAGQVFKLGTAADDDACITAGTLSDTAQLVRFNSAALPFKVSLSDDVTPQWTWLYLTRVSGTSTATASIQLVVTYAAKGAAEV